MKTRRHASPAEPTLPEFGASPNACELSTGCDIGGACRIGNGKGRAFSGAAVEGNERHARIAAHLNAAAKRVFLPLIGLRFFVVLLPPGDRTKDGSSVAPFCRDIPTDVRSRAVCSMQLPRHLSRVLVSSDAGHLFTCALGFRNLWIPLMLDGICFGLAVLQCAKCPQAHRPCPLLADARQFNRAVMLLRLLVRDTLQTELAAHRENPIRQSSIGAQFSEKKSRQPHSLPQLTPPVFPKLESAAKPLNALIEQLIERIHRDWNRPISLKALANEFRRNSAYLSDIFAQATGRPFKAYLTDLRLTHASVLLGNGLLTVAEIAHQSGFTDSQQFRRAFKKRFGCPPCASPNSTP